jgi:rfaE bifunctional protein kinase chain/domain
VRTSRRASPQASPASGPNQALELLLERFPRATVAVVGDLVADEYVVGETDRISREAPVLVVRYERSELKAGCAANAVMNLCALGAGSVRPVGLVGDDRPGALLRGLLEEAGADVSGVLVAEGAPTASKMRILAGGKNTRRQQIVRLDRDGPGVPSGVLLKRLLAALRTALRGADAVLVSDYGLGLLEALRPALFGLAGARPVCVDARYHLRDYRGAALLKPNEVELEQAVGRRLGGTPEALEAAGRDFLEQLGAKALLVTRGRHGMALLRPGHATALIAAHGEREAVDVTGAGDTVMAATTLGLACGADAVLAARLANVAGALVVQKPGTATVSRAELAAELAAGPVLPAGQVVTGNGTGKRKARATP